MYDRIRNLREDHDLSQNDIAGLLGMSQTGYSKYETGENDVPISVLVRLALIYNTTTDYLLGITDNSSPGPLNEESRARLEEYRTMFRKTCERKAAARKNRGKKNENNNS